MSADFIVAAAPADTTHEEAIENLRKLTDEQVVDAFVAALGFDPIDAGEARVRVRYAIDEIVESERTDMGMLYLGDRSLYVTGGMSWGDVPSEAFDEINLLDATGVTTNDPKETE